MKKTRSEVKKEQRCVALRGAAHDSANIVGWTGRSPSDWSLRLSVQSPTPHLDPLVSLLPPNAPVQVESSRGKHAARTDHPRDIYCFSVHVTDAQTEV